MTEPTVPWRKSFPSYKGGRTWLDNRGYVAEHAPDHPHCRYNGFVPQHKLVMEDYLGRYLHLWEHIHHKNEIRCDNRIENLEVVSRKAHNCIHKKYHWLTEEKVREALQGRTTIQAASFLGVSHNTLRENFDRLLSKRKTPWSIDDKRVQEIVREHALDPYYGILEMAKDYNVAPKFVQSVCDHIGIKWVRKTRKDKGLSRPSRSKGRKVTHDQPSGPETQTESSPAHTQQNVEAGQQ